MSVTGLIIYTLLVVIVLLVILLYRQNQQLQGNPSQQAAAKDSQDKGCREALSKCENDKNELNKKIQDLESQIEQLKAQQSQSDELQHLKDELESSQTENSQLKDENEALKKELDELKQKAERVSALLSEEEKARIRAEEKVIEEKMNRLEDSEKAKRVIEALEVESQMAVIVAQEKAKKDQERLQKQAEEEKKALQEELELEKAKWSTAVTSASKKIADLSFGKIRAVNNLDLDQLINVHGKNRPIAVFVQPRSSNLSLSGAFIYDTHKIKKDNALYLFVGPDCPQALEELGEKLLEAYHMEYADAELVRIIRTTDSPEFARLIKVIGGHIDQLQPSVKAGDELFFENNFFKVKLHLIIFSNGETETPEIKTISVDDLPKEGAAIIDTSDTALYLYIPHSDPINDVEKADQEKCIKWMSEQQEYNGRDVTIFNETCIPPNLKVLFNIV